MLDKRHCSLPMVSPDNSRTPVLSDFYALLHESSNSKANLVRTLLTIFCSARSILTNLVSNIAFGNFVGEARGVLGICEFAAVKLSEVVVINSSSEPGG